MVFPKQYQYLLKEPGPRLLTEFLKLYGVTETPGPANNPTILSWAREIGLGHIYKQDSIAWCGLVMAYVAAQSGWEYAPRGNALYARNWIAWGNPAPRPMLGDVMIFTRKGGGHVGIYVGEDSEAFHILGGNQSDQVNIRRKLRNTFMAARRCPWRVRQPANIRSIKIGTSGIVSTNEA